MNSVLLTGHLVYEPVIRRTAKDVEVANLVVAVRVGDESGESHIDVVCWGPKAVPCRTYKPGDKVLVSGALKVESWEREGTTRRRVVVVADFATTADDATQDAQVVTQGSRQGA